MKRAFPLILIAAATIATGCAHSGPKSIATIQKELNQWKTGSENPLIAFVPDSTPLVIATQRTSESNTQTLANRFNQVFDQLESTHAADALDFDYLFYQYDYDDDDLDDEYADDEDLTFSTPENDAKLRKIEENRAKRELLKIQDQERRQAYENWKNNCLVNLDPNDAEKLLQQDNCDAPENKDSCGCQTRATFSAPYFTNGFELSDVNSSIREYIKKNTAIQLLKNPVKLGFKEPGKTDAVFYFNGSNPVIKIAVDDGQKVMDLIKSIMGKIYLGNAGDNQSWIIYGHSELDTFQFAFNNDQNIITAAVIFDNEIPDLNTPASTPAKLRATSPNDLLVSKLTYDKIHTLFSNETVAAVLDLLYLDEFADKDLKTAFKDWRDRKDVSYSDLFEHPNSYINDIRADLGITSINNPVCADELSLLNVGYKDMEAHIAIDNNGLFSLAINQHQTPEIYKQTSEIIEPYSDYSNLDPIASLAFGINISKTLNLALERSKKIVNYNYQCPHVKALVDFAFNDIKALDSMPAEVLMFIQGLHSQYYALLDFSGFNLKFFGHVEHDSIRRSVNDLLKKEFKFELKENEVIHKDDLSVFWSGDAIDIGYSLNNIKNIKPSKQVNNTIMEMNISKKLINKFLDNLYIFDYFSDMLENIRMTMTLNKDSIDFTISEHK